MIMDKTVASKLIFVLFENLLKRIHIGGEEYTVYTKILSQPHCIFNKYLNVY